jgi:hypothetical protein
MRTLIALTALCIALPSQAADHELSFEMASFAAKDPAWDTFSPDNTMTTLGLRAGYRVHDRVAVIGSYHHTRTGSDLYDGINDVTLGRAAFFGNEFALGGKADLSVKDFMLPYVTLSGLLLYSDVRFDDDPDDDDNPGQVKETTFSGGLRGMGGLEFRIPRWEPPGFTVGAYLELGYTYLSPISVGGLGDMDLGGFTVRGGLGVRY